MDEKIFSIITKDMMEDYESIRSSGAINMLDYYSVIKIAEVLDMSLRELSLNDYKLLLMNFSSLMKHYDIAQTH